MEQAGGGNREGGERCKGGGRIIKDDVFHRGGVEGGGENNKPITSKNKEKVRGLEQEEEEARGEERNRPPHAVQRGAEVLAAQRVALPQQDALLQRHRHGRPVLGALAAGETHAVDCTTHLD